MAKAENHTKPETWIPLRKIHAAAPRALDEKFRRQPYRYLDRDGVRHDNDLSDDFLANAVFSPDHNRAFWNGGDVSTEEVLSKSIDAERLQAADEKYGADHDVAIISGVDALTPERLLAAAEKFADRDFVIILGWHEPISAAEAASYKPHKQPRPLSRLWRRDPYDPQCARSYEVEFPSWEANEIEFLKEPVPGASAPDPLPKRLNSKAVLANEINRRKAAGEKRPCDAELAHELAIWTKAPAQSERGIKSLHRRTIANYISKFRL